jgi:hypothetical protein
MIRTNLSKAFRVRERRAPRFPHFGHLGCGPRRFPCKPGSMSCADSSCRSLAERSTNASVTSLQSPAHRRPSPPVWGRPWAIWAERGRGKAWRRALPTLPSDSSSPDATVSLVRELPLQLLRSHRCRPLEAQVMPTSTREFVGRNGGPIRAEKRGLPERLETRGVMPLVLRRSCESVEGLSLYRSARERLPQSMP